MPLNCDTGMHWMSAARPLRARCCAKASGSGSASTRSHQICAARASAGVGAMATAASPGAWPSLTRTPASAAVRRTRPVPRSRSGEVTRHVRRCVSRQPRWGRTCRACSPPARRRSWACPRRIFRSCWAIPTIVRMAGPQRPAGSRSSAEMRYGSQRNRRPPTMRNTYSCGTTTKRHRPGRSVKAVTCTSHSVSAHRPRSSKST